MANEGMDFKKSRGFIEGTKLITNISRNRGWSKNDMPSKVIASFTCSTPITNVGAILVDSVINISLRKLISTVALKKSLA